MRLNQIAMVALLLGMVATLVGVFDLPAVWLFQASMKETSPTIAALLAYVVLWIFKGCWLGAFFMVLDYALRFGRIPNIFGDDI